MKYYCDITLLVGQDVTINFLWSKVYRKLHSVLVTIKNSDGRVPVAVSFPEYKQEGKQLGTKLRLFASTQETLETLSIPSELQELRDYTHVTSILEVPKGVDRFAYFGRSQPKTSNARLARRKSRREGITEEAAEEYFASREEQYSNLPFVQMRSSSNNQEFRLFINRSETDRLEFKAGYNTYGLSNQSSVPLF